MIFCTHDPGTHHALAIIHARDSKLVGHRYELDPSAAVITVGRHRENTITIDSDAVSRRHARVERRAEGWWVVDSNSTHGTFVNGERVPEALLRDGDQIRMGDTFFKLTCALCERAIDQRQYSATPIDGLTKAYNRRYFIEQLDNELRRTERPPALVMFDLDHFKKLNDAYGHLAGDHVLREIASIMRQRIRPDDILARYSGEEFALMLPGTDLQGAAALAETIRAEIAARVITFEERALSITISAGVARADESSLSASDLIRSADQKLYQAKLGGRNRVLM